jgi:hypothetical protein
MPWCEDCSRFFTPPSMNADGTCPSCGRALVDPGAVTTDAPRAPWHFKLLVAALIVYLTWRFLQLIVWAMT